MQTINGGSLIENVRELLGRTFGYVKVIKIREL